MAKMYYIKRKLKMLMLNMINDLIFYFIAKSEFKNSKKFFFFIS